MGWPQKLFSSLATTLVLSVTVIALPVSPAAAQDANGPYLCEGGENAQTVRRYDHDSYLGPEVGPWWSIGEDRVCVPQPELCANSLTTRGPKPAYIIPGGKPVSSIVCQSGAQGIVPFENGYAQYLTERRYSPDGQFLHSVELITEVIAYPTPTIAFDGQTVYFDATSGLKSQASSVAELAFAVDFSEADANVLRLYWAFFNRMPDLEGAKYWLDIAKNVLTLDEIAQYFATSEEFRLHYGEVNSEEFLTIAYQNVLGRTYDQAGFDYWLDLLQRGALTRGGTVRWVAASTEFIGSHPYPSPSVPDNVGDWPTPGQHTLARCDYSVSGTVAQKGDGTVSLRLDLRTPSAISLQDLADYRFVCNRALNTKALPHQVTLNGYAALSDSGSSQTYVGRIETALAFSFTFPSEAWDPDGNDEIGGSVRLLHETHGSFDVPLADLTDSVFVCPLFCV